MSVSPAFFTARGRTIRITAQPLLMGIVNASPDSFSDGGRQATLEDRVTLAHRLVDDGAAIIDVGGESATTGRAPVDPRQEVELVEPLVRRIADELDVLISVDTYKPAVAAAALDAGAHIVNDVSGLRDPALADVCAREGAALVLMHTAAAPRVRVQDDDLYGNIADDVVAFLRARIDIAVARGVERDALIVDPGPDFAKTPAQTIELLGAVDRLHEFERPILMAISRKDFIGALTERPPRGRDAGTLGALAHGIDHGAQIFRLHDVAGAADFLKVRAALAEGGGELTGVRLADELRHEPASG